MDDKMFRFKFIVLAIVVLIIGIIAAQPLYEDKKPIVAMSRENYEIQTHTIDSLQNVVDSLHAGLETQTKEYDRSENRYKDIIAEYTYGMEWIKLYHPNAYKDFHRVIAYKERYSRLSEQENIQRLSNY
jgi:hypothetical protein